ncbi:NAD-dependent protein deacylase [Sphingobacteriales bacterium UPWRP_1]|nr:NAD-dependent protein deacylase [Sphingobacteriales bacterium TSM_CSM]PSJ75060.1 NAD-dependent protein deacylase [Sphingobacteriales bacterium UPWRP_1]
MQKPHVVVLTGAGISAESGLATFRGMGGMWEEYRIEDVASITAWRRNPALVLEFYNQRRKAAAQAQPNEGHKALAKLEKKYRVTIVTQNVDDLHERAGSSNIIHVHGKLSEVRSEKYPDLVFDIGGEAIQLGDLCPRGSQLRPNIVWFGEAVPMIEIANQIASTADIFIIIGTSLVVYPAAGLINYVPKQAEKYLIDPHIPDLPYGMQISIIAEPATVGAPQLVNTLLERL